MKYRIDRPSRKGLETFVEMAAQLGHLKQPTRTP
jgi:hypothetical protein